MKVIERSYSRKFKEFEGFEDELIEANTTYRKTKQNDDKYIVEANAEGRFKRTRRIWHRIIPRTETKLS